MLTDAHKKQGTLLPLNFCTSKMQDLKGCFCTVV